MHYISVGIAFRVCCGLQVADTSDSSGTSSGDDDNGDGTGDGDGKGTESDLPLVDFGVVVAGKERFDVCRLFLASLQLVGHGHGHCFWRGMIGDTGSMQPAVLLDADHRAKTVFVVLDFGLMHLVYKNQRNLFRTSNAHLNNV